MAGSLYFIRKEENLEKENSFQYAFYEVEPRDSVGETSVLGKPLCVFDQPADRMSFIAVESKIFMIGGIDSVGGISVPSSRTYILDRVTYEITEGPTMMSGKSRPFLHRIGARIYVLSRFVYLGSEGRRGFDPPPHFEVLDTARGEDAVWTPLPLPFIFSSSNDDVPLPVNASCVFFAVGGSELILISFNKLGTYLFDTLREEWEHISGDVLPFSGKAISIPNAPSSLSLAVSLRSNKWSAFQFNYANKKYRVNEIEIEVDQRDLYSSPTLFNECLVTAVHDQRIYFLSSGFEDPDSKFSGIGDIYIKVAAVVLEKANQGEHKFGLKRCSTSNREGEVEYEGEGGEGGERKFKFTRLWKKVILYIKVAAVGLEKANQGEHKFGLKRCSTSNREGEVEHEGEGEERKFKFTPLWKKVIFGGPLSDQFEHLSQAFVI